MADNYRFTAERTGKSSKTLHEKGEYFDACYLSGYVVECYQKILYVYVSGRNPRQSHDLDILKQELRYIKNSSKAGFLRKTGIWVEIELICSTIYNSWGPEHRYDDAYTWDEATSDIYQKEIKKCLFEIGQLVTRGLIK